MCDYYKLFTQLSQTFGPSGREQEIRETIQKLAEPYADEICTDTLGNLIVHKKGEGKKLMFCAHMDSIGVVATYIDEKGFIRFGSIGGLFKGDLVNIQVRFQNGTKGVISYEEKTPFKDLSLDNLFIDIGAGSREEAEKLVKVGDFAVFHSPIFQQGDVICGPYLDNRIGCAVLLETLKRSTENDKDLYFVFSVQEEVGLRGAGPAAFDLSPDYAVAVDVTDTGDLPERKYAMAVAMGKGAAVKVMDHSVICSAPVRESLEQAAASIGLPVQQEIMEFGGTDTSAIQKSRSGVLTGAVSIPTRYIHSPSEMASIRDIDGCVQLLTQWICMC